MIESRCVECGRPFLPETARVKLCSDKCRRERQLKQMRAHANSGRPRPESIFKFRQAGGPLRVPAAAPIAPRPADRLMRQPEVGYVTGLSKSMMYLLMARGDFPKPVKISERAVGWRQGDIEAWMRERVST